MTETALPARSRLGDLARWAAGDGRVWLVAFAILAVLAVADIARARESAAFALANLADTAPYLLLSIGLAAYAGATGADGLVARAFIGAPALMILMAVTATLVVLPSVLVLITRDRSVADGLVEPPVGSAADRVQPEPVG